GLLFGAVFGSAPGIFLGHTRRMVAGAGIGALIGVAGGSVGFLAGQAVLLLVGERIIAPGTQGYTVSIPLARALGWAILGACVGAADGLRARSALKARAGAIGGLSGGLVGGLVVEYGRYMLPGEPYARLVAFVCFGLAIALFLAIVEKRLSFGVLRVLNGPRKGEEFIVNQRVLVVGSDDRCDAVLGEYDGVHPRHFSLYAREGEVYVAVYEGQVRWNDEPVDAAVSEQDSSRAAPALKFEDVIAAGSVKLLYLPE
ncbi:MAG: FHA domain-containing protein, partial [Spirochaetales bacterium]